MKPVMNWRPLLLAVAVGAALWAGIIALVVRL